MKILFFLALITLSTPAILAQDHPDSLPDFKIFDLDNEVFTQDDVSSDTYVFFIYFNPTCGHCETAFKTLNLRAEDLMSSEFILYPVSAKNSEETQAFFKSHAPKLLTLENMQILIDDNYKFADAFFVRSYPNAYLYNKRQELVNVYNGEEEIMNFLDDIE